MNKIPKLLTENGLYMFVNDIKLRELPISIQNIPIEKFLWHFDMPIWDKDRTDDWNLTPWQVIRKEEGSTAHQKRVKEVDFSYPLIVAKFKNKLVILDGVHRLVKAYLEGRSDIEGKIIPKKLLKVK